jgi:radical S-adenosyl methionine domain-containing protein 2
MSCTHCFAPFHDVRAQLPKGHLPEMDAVAVVRLLVEARFEKVNFVGGEPLLCPWLPRLIRVAKRGGATTSVVTNATRLTPAWLDAVAGDLDWVGISIDSASEDTHASMGRAVRGRALTEARYLAAANAARDRGIRLKVNTVVTRRNADEDMSALITRLRPERWKVFQALAVEGQNDPSLGFLVSDADYRAFVDRHAGVAAMGIELVPESNELMRGSYAMVDPAGRFFDNAGGGHRYGRPILEVGVASAMEDVSVDAERFVARGGRYEWGSRVGRARSRPARRPGLAAGTGRSGSLRDFKRPRPPADTPACHSSPSRAASRTS